MAGHTKGPWTARSDGTNYYQITSKTYVVGTLQAFDHPGINGPANARLIAAAPDLLEALEKAVSQIAIWKSINGDMVGALAELENECRAAITRARTGEGG